jgi:hypothetical protein
MTKHVEQDNASLLKQFKENIVAHLWSHHDCEPTTKWQQIAPSLYWVFFPPQTLFRKIMTCKKGFYKI